MRSFMRSAWILGTVGLSLAACMRSGGKEAKEPLAADEPKGQSSATPSTSALTPPKASDVPDSCQVLPGVEADKAFYLAGKAVVLTRMFKSCVTREGRAGFEKGSPWLAMGFPCTGGSGKIDIKGHYHNPKMVSFLVATDCAMSAAPKEAVHKMFSDAVKMPADSPLMGIYPFAVQYWEVPGFPDADVGFAVELRSSPGIEGGWTRVKEREPMRVRLFGRENAWVRGEHFFAVEADIELAGTTSFTLKIVDVKTMTGEELEQLRQRCQALRPLRNCAAII